MLITEERLAIDFLKTQLNHNDFDLLERYSHIVLKQSKLFNLISKNTIDQIWQRHILDSYQLINHIQKEDVVTDIGSGAGFPGIVLTILGVKNLTMIDSLNKKVKFINETLNQLGFPSKAIHTRIEDVNLTTDILTARALKPLKEIFVLIHRNIIVNKKILLLKGSKTYEEISEAQQDWQFEYKLHKSITSENSFIIEIHPKIFLKN
jgi:16S rRNA (guanine527-N7)-methyltransferase